MTTAFCLRLDAYQFICVILALLVASYGNSSYAQTHVVTAIGTLDSISATDLDGMDATDAFRGILPFDTGALVTSQSYFDISAVDTDSFASTNGDTFGVYYSGWTNLTIGSTTFTYDNKIFVTDRPNNVDSLRFATFFPTLSFEGAPGWDLDFVRGVGFTMESRFTDNSSLLLPSDSLDLPVFTESSLSSATWRINASSSSEFGGSNTVNTPLGSHIGLTHEMTGLFSSVTMQAIPEPAAGTFMLFLGSIIVLKRSRLRFDG